MRATEKITRTAKPTSSTRSLDRREQVLADLEELVLTSGFAHLTVTDMVSKLHCSRRAIYDVAPGKNELIELILERFFARIRASATRNIAGVDDPRQRIYQYLIVGVSAAARMSPAVIADIDRHPRTRNIWNEHIRLRVHGLKDLVEEGIRMGRFRPVHSRLVSELLYGILRRIREPDFYVDTDLTPSEAFREVYTLLMEALVTDKETAYFDRPRSPARGDSD